MNRPLLPVMGRIRFVRNSRHPSKAIIGIGANIGTNCMSGLKEELIIAIEKKI
jgi:hypothetical protein